MNYFTRALTLTAGMAAAAVLAAAAPFEGQVDFAIQHDESAAPQTFRYALKGELVRLDLKAAGQSIAAIIDPAQQDMVVLMPDQNIYTRMSLQQGMRTLIQGGALNSTARLERSGRSETILGYRCTLVLVKEGAQVTELWLAEGLGNLHKIATALGSINGGSNKGLNASWEAALIRTDGFPLRVISRNAAKQIIFKMEALKVTSRPLPAIQFKAPAAYQEITLPNLTGLNFLR